MIVKNKGIPKDIPPITVIMINTLRNEEWFKQAVSSVMNQTYPIDDNGKTKIELLIMNNQDKKKTIGKCWNEMIKRAKHDYIFILDDDDWIAHDLLLSLMLHYLKAKKKPMHKNCIGVSPYVTLFEYKDNKKVRYLSHYYTSAMVKKEWLLKIPFKENIKSQVDCAWDKDMLKAGKTMLLTCWQYGYFYRQHNKMVSGRNMQVKTNAS